jgi:hypothetical protein
MNFCVQEIFTILGVSENSENFLVYSNLNNNKLLITISSQNERISLCSHTVAVQYRLPTVLGAQTAPPAGKVNGQFESLPGIELEFESRPNSQAAK